MIHIHAPIRLFRTAPLLLAAVFGFALSSHLRAQKTASTPPNQPVRLTLPAAVDMAIAHNRKLQLARLAVQDSSEKKRVAESHYFPEIKNDSLVLHITELQGIVLPAASLSSGTSAGPIPAKTLRINQGAATGYTSGTGLIQPLTQMFKIHAGVRAADADLRIATIQADEAEDAVALQVHQLYYSYLVTQLSGSAAEDALKASSLTEEESQKGVQEGRLLAEAELSSHADLLDKRRAVLMAKLSLDDLSLQLDDLLGLPIGTKLELDADALGELPSVPSRTEAIVQVLQKSPAVLAARQAVEKARAGVSAAHDAYIPDITGIARYSYQSGLPFLEHNFGSFGASVSYTLFDGGARESNLRDAKIKLSMAQTQLAQTQSDVQVEISAAYDKAEQLQELMQVSQLALQAREESYRVQSERSQVDAELASGVASSHSAVVAAKLNALTSRLNLYLANDNIKKLLGEVTH